MVRACSCRFYTVTGWGKIRINIDRVWSGLSKRTSVVYVSTYSRCMIIWRSSSWNMKPPNVFVHSILCYSNFFVVIHFQRTVNEQYEHISVYSILYGTVLILWIGKSYVLNTSIHRKTVFCFITFHTRVDSHTTTMKFHDFCTRPLRALAVVWCFLMHLFIKLTLAEK